MRVYLDRLELGDRVAAALGLESRFPRYAIRKRCKGYTY